ANFQGREHLVWLLHQPDFSTAARLAQGINERFGAPLAAAYDAGAVVVRVPPESRSDVVAFIAAVEEVTVQPDTPARVVINERTGTVVMGHHVRIAQVAVAHGNLTVRIGRDPEVVQPPPFSRGETVII